MDSSNIYFLSMTTRVIYLCVNNQVVVLTLPAFNDFITELTTRKSICDGYNLILQGKTLGITIESVKLKKDIALNYGVCASAVSAYGASIEDDKLKNIEIFTYSQLLRTKPEELKVSLANILAIIDTNKVALVPFGISPAFTTKLTTLQTNLNDTAFGTKNAIDLHKATNELLEEELSEMQLLYSDKLDPLAEFFKLDQLAFYKLYRSARKVPHHHIHDKTPVPPDPTTGSLALTLMNSITGLPAQNINLSILSINYTANSDINGEISNTTLLPGEYNGTLTCDGFVSIDFTFTIKLGEISEIGFMMEPVIIPK